MREETREVKTNTNNIFPIANLSIWKEENDNLILGFLLLSIPSWSTISKFHRNKRGVNTPPPLVLLESIPSRTQIFDLTTDSMVSWNINPSKHRHTYLITCTKLSGTVPPVYAGKRKPFFFSFASQKIYQQEMQWLEALNTDENSDWLI